LALIALVGFSANIDLISTLSYVGYELEASASEVALVAVASVGGEPDIRFGTCIVCIDISVESSFYG